MEIDARGNEHFLPVDILHLWFHLASFICNVQLVHFLSNCYDLTEGFGR